MGVRTVGGGRVTAPRGAAAHQGGGAAVSADPSRDARPRALVPRSGLSATLAAITVGGAAPARSLAWFAVEYVIDSGRSRVNDLDHAPSSRGRKASGWLSF